MAKPITIKEIKRYIRPPKDLKNIIKIKYTINTNETI